MWSPFVSLPFQKLGRRKCNFHDRREFECINIACGPWIWHGLEAFCSLGRQSQSLGPASKEAESAAPANVSCCSESCKCCSRFCKGTAPHTDGNHLWLLGVGLSLLTTRAARTLTWPLQSAQLKHSSRLSAHLPSLHRQPLSAGYVSFLLQEGEWSQHCATARWSTSLAPALPEPEPFSPPSSCPLGAPGGKAALLSSQFRQEAEHREKRHLPKVLMRVHDNVSNWSSSLKSD